MIDDYRFGAISIDGTEYQKDLILFPDRVQETWWREKGHDLIPEDLKDVVDARPSLVVIGTGCYGGLKVPDETIQWLRAQGAEVYIAPTSAACAHYNTLTDRSGVVAALHLTC